MFRKLIFVVVTLTANVVLMSADSSDASGQIFRRWAGSSSNSYNMSNQRYAQPQATQYQTADDGNARYAYGAQPRAYANQYQPARYTQRNQTQNQPQSSCTCQQVQARAAAQQYSQQAGYNAPANRHQQIQRTTYIDPRTNRQVDLARQQQPSRFVRPQTKTINGTLSPVQPIATASRIATQPAIQPATAMPQGSITTLEPVASGSSGLSLTSPVGTTTINSVEPMQNDVAPQESFSVLEMAE